VHRWQVKEPVEPSEVLWHNYHWSYTTRCIRYMLSTLGCGISLVIR
jgi:hypothetical protein